MKQGSVVQNIGIVSDHAGVHLKARLIHHLESQGITPLDFGVSTPQTSVDYVDYASILGSKLNQGVVTSGIAICGTGIGIAMTLNKFPNVRACVVWDEFTAKVSRGHNDANVLCLGARVLDHDRAVDFLKIWLETPFEGGRHAIRLAKLKALELAQFKSC